MLEVERAADLKAYEGKEIGVSDWYIVTQEQIDKFADATGDHQWIHVDVERATKELGAPIAHGYLILSIIPFLARNIIGYKGIGRFLNYGCNKVRFANVVPVGKRIRLQLKLLNVEQRGAGLQITSQCTVEIEGEERPACVAETVAVAYPE